MCRNCQINTMKVKSKVQYTLSKENKYIMAVYDEVWKKYKVVKSDITDEIYIKSVFPKAEFISLENALKSWR